MNEKTIFERWLGPSWRTSVTGFLETIVALSTAWAFLPDTVRKDPFAICGALAAAVLKTWKERHIKDSNVSGTPATGMTVENKDGDVRVLPPEPPKNTLP